MKEKKPRNYAKSKKAFDEVMKAYRSFLSVSIGVGMPQVVEIKDMVNVRALSLPSPTSPNPKRPSISEFRCDVEKVVKLRLKGGITVRQFREAYIEFDSEDVIEREVHAQQVIGSRRHSVEQRVGEEFIRRRIYPVGKGYFHVIR